MFPLMGFQMSCQDFVTYTITQTKKNSIWKEVKGEAWQTLSQPDDQDQHQQRYVMLTACTSSQERIKRAPTPT